MKRFCFLLISYVFFIFADSGKLHGQNYIKLYGETGVSGESIAQSDLDALTTASQELIDLVEAENTDYIDQFRVYDFGFYLHQESFQEDYSATVNAAVTKAETQSPYYLLFGRQTDHTGINTKLWIRFNFPTSTLECLDSEKTEKALQVLGDKIYNQSGHAGSSVFSTEVSIIGNLKRILSEGFCCSNYHGNLRKDTLPQLRSTNSCGVDALKVQQAFLLLKDDPIYFGVVDKMTNIYEFYQNCQDQNWESEAKDGIIPKCIWEDTSVPPLLNYTFVDLPFYMGATDGLYSEAIGLADFLLSLDDFAGTLENVLYSYTLYYLICPPDGREGVELSKSEIIEVYEKLREEESGTWQFPNLKTIFDAAYDAMMAGFREAQLMFYGSTKEFCEELEETRNTVDKLYEAIQNLNNWVILFNSLIEEAGTLWENINGFTNTERYYHGYYGIKIASAFVGISEIKYLGKLGQFIDDAMAKIKGSGRKNYVRDLNTKLAENLISRIRKTAPYSGWPAATRRQFDLDFAEDYNALKRVEEGEWFEAWDALFDLPALRINPTKLKAVDDFATAKNIDQSLIKTELDNLPGYKEDLIRGFEISNGTASYPTISNKGVIQTDGNLLGKLENGQFVPVGNAQAAGTMDYVVMQNGEILLGSKHTFLSQGEDVLAAGTVKFNVNGNGTLSDISNASGHYLPTPGEGMNFLRLFKSKGVDTQNTFLSIYEEGGTIFKQVHPNANARKLYE